MVARILLIFSVANIALAAPAAVRQRHLDIAKAASQKRGPGSDNGETGDFPPELSSRMPPHESGHDGPTNGWADSSSAYDTSDEAESSSAYDTSDEAESSSAATYDTSDEAPGALGLDNGETRDLATASSSSDSAHLGDLPPPPHQGSAPQSLAAPEADRPFRDTLTHKVLLYSGVAGVIGITAALAYGIHKWIKHPYVSPLFPADI
jgi:hypothetical protein